MTEQEAIEQIEALTSADPEMAHPQAEEILCDFLKAQGFTALASAFNEAVDRCDFWYA